MAQKSTGNLVVLLSGGLDSSVLLQFIAAERPDINIHTLSFDYGQKHSKELACASFQAAKVDSSHHVLDISFVGAMLQNSSALLSGGVEVPNLADLDSTTLQQPPTYVPNRNMILLSLAAAFAESKGAQDIYYGAQAQDEYGYWDCTVDFLGRINATLALNRRNAVRVHAPLIQNSKADNVALGIQLGVDFSKTWSCYRGGEKACGTCPTCIERLNAFKSNGLPDPLAYL